LGDKEIKLKAINAHNPLTLNLERIQEARKLIIYNLGSSVGHETKEKP